MEVIQNRLDNRQLTASITVDGAQGEEVVLTTAIRHVNERQFGAEAGITGIIKYQDKEENEDIDGTIQTMIKTRSAEFVFIPNPIHLLIFKGRAEAGKMADKISTLLYNQREDPIISCQIRAHDMDGFIRRHVPEVRSCTWADLTIPDLHKANLTGQNIEADAGFMRFDDHGVKDSIRLYLPGRNMTIGITSKASVQFYNRLTTDEKVAFLQQYILEICR